MACTVQALVAHGASRTACKAHAFQVVAERYGIINRLYVRERGNKSKDKRNLPEGPSIAAIYLGNAPPFGGR